MLIKENMQKAMFEEENKETALLPEETPQAAQNLETEMTIEGPVKGRKIIRRPAPPKVDITIGVELKLKFWVLPDGTIGEVVPLKRGDAQLEQIAIAYLKQWQFEPLALGSPQQKIWGTIPIRFIVQ
jgi:TonB family protein